MVSQTNSWIVGTGDPIGLYDTVKYVIILKRVLQLKRYEKAL